MVGASIYWFRNDLRLHDNPQFLKACQQSDSLIPIYILPQDEETPWGFARVGRERQTFLDQCLADLREQLMAHGSTLLLLQGDPVQSILTLAQEQSVKQLYCESIAAPEEQAVLEDLGRQGMIVDTQWQSSMLDPACLGYELKDLPNVFTQFRHQVEQRELKFTRAQPPANPIPTLPFSASTSTWPLPSSGSGWITGGERNALVHLEQYLQKRLPDTYKKTRNELSRFDASSKFSPWLASGALSARIIMERLDAYESEYGANEGTYWLWFELLWRDYFRFLGIKYGKRLFHGKGLSSKSPFPFDASRFEQWRTGTTGVDLVDAGMRELQTTGYLSNRMRQIVASYWIYAMQGHWQAGAAWFEHCLVDYDVYSNQGNWLYIAGHGTDPRGGRAFNIAKQIEQYDADGSYRKRWLD